MDTHLGVHVGCTPIDAFEQIFVRACRGFGGVVKIQPVCGEPVLPWCKGPSEFFFCGWCCDWLWHVVTLVECACYIVVLVCEAVCEVHSWWPKQF